MFQHGSNSYDVEMLWKITEKNKIEIAPTIKFLNLLNLEYWTDERGRQTTPMDVVTFEKDRAYAQHLAAIERADLQYPILMTEIDGDAWIVVDGVHRIAKTFLEHRPLVQYRRVTPGQMEEARIFPRTWAWSLFSFSY